MNPPDLPIIQLTLGREGEPDVLLSLTPLGLRDFFAARALELARELPITDADLQTLAANFEETRHDFELQVKEAICGTILMVIRKYHGPAELLKLLDELRRDWAATLVRHADDDFARFVAKTIQDAVAETRRPTDEVIAEHAATIREVVRRGNPGLPARAIFLEALTAIAAAQGDDLALPPRDHRPGRPRSTPFFAFATGMVELLVRCGNHVLDRRGLARGRFDKFDKGRRWLVTHLERSRDVILAEISVSPHNS